MPEEAAAVTVTAPAPGPVSTWLSKEGFDHAVLPADHLGVGWWGLRVPERERRVIVVRGKNGEWGSDGEVFEMVGDDQERWR